MGRPQQRTRPRWKRTFCRGRDGGTLSRVAETKSDLNWAALPLPGTEFASLRWCKRRLEAARCRLTIFPRLGIRVAPPCTDALRTKRRLLESSSYSIFLFHPSSPAHSWSQTLYRPSYGLTVPYKYALSKSATLPTDTARVPVCHSTWNSTGFSSLLTSCSPLRTQPSSWRVLA